MFYALVEKWYRRNGNLRIIKSAFKLEFGKCFLEKFVNKVKFYEKIPSFQDIINSCRISYKNWISK